LETRFSRIPLANRRLQPSTTPGTLPTDDVAGNDSRCEIFFEVARKRVMLHRFAVAGHAGRPCGGDARCHFDGPPYRPSCCGRTGTADPLPVETAAKPVYRVPC
ncbi:hypothetical protein, partial [Burkholderia contaminans]|uniref:hypothetical protein n=1 Tax=Burkholderia contaminans TaxID=488447 RepID=UPI001C2E64D1